MPDPEAPVRTKRESFDEEAASRAEVAETVDERMTVQGVERMRVSRKSFSGRPKAPAGLEGVTSNETTLPTFSGEELSAVKGGNSSLWLVPGWKTSGMLLPPRRFGGSLL